MYTGVLSFKVQPSRLDEVERLWNERLGEAKALKGYQGALFLVDQRSGRILSIGLWETAEDAAAFRSSGAMDRFVSAFEGLFVQRPDREIYEIRAVDRLPLEAAFEEGKRKQTEAPLHS